MNYLKALAQQHTQAKERKKMLRKWQQKCIQLQQTLGSIDPDSREAYEYRAQLYQLKCCVHDFCEAHNLDPQDYLP